MILFGANVEKLESGLQPRLRAIVGGALEAREKEIKEAQRAYDREVGRARVKRQKAFAKANRHGATFAEIGRIVGLSESLVEQIVQGS